MTTRQRVTIPRQITITGGGGPGGGVIANVVWGPNFGEEDELPIGIQGPAITALALDNTRNLGHAPKLEVVSIDIFTPITEGSSLSLPALALDGQASGGLSIEMPVLVLDGERTLGVGAPVMDTLALDGERTLGHNVTLPELALDATRQLGEGLSMVLGLDGERTLGHNATFPALSVDGTRQEGVHVLAEVLGAPFWQAVTTAQATTNNVTVSCPSSLAVGDLLLAFVGAIGTVVTNISADDAGWNNSPPDFLSQSAIGANWFYHLVTGSEPGTFSFTAADTVATTRMTAEIHHIKGVDGTTPIDGVTATSSAAQADPIAPTITPSVANCLVFANVIHDHAALSQSHTPAAGHVERTDHQSVTPIFIGSCSITKVFPAAATGTVTFDCSETVPTPQISHRIAIRPGTQVIAA